MAHLFARFRSRRSQEKLVDVHVIKNSAARRGSVFSYERIINLRKTFTARHSVALAAIIGLAVLGYVLSRASFSNAAVVTYYPSTCLGTWQYADRAAGEPEGGVDDPSSVLEEYAAFHAGTEGSIYCGGFSPEDPSATGTLTEVSLSLVWRIGTSAAAPTSEESSPESQEATPSESVPSSDEEGVTPPEGSEVPAVVTSTVPFATSTATTSMRHRLLFASWFAVPQVSAQETPPEVPPDAPSQEPVPPPQPGPAPETPSEPSPVSETPVEEPHAAEPAEPPVEPPADVPETPLQEPGADVQETVPTTSAPSTEPEEGAEVPLTLDEAQPEKIPATENPGVGGGAGASESSPLLSIPNEDFLEIAYSLDGTAWFELGRVNPSNWPSFTTRLPVTTWDDVRRLQVRIGSVETSLLAIPHTYLDGMILAVQYEPPAIPESQDTETAPDPHAEDFLFNNPLILELPPEENPQTQNETGTREEPVREILIDQNARHRCVVTPFSGDLERGGRAVQFSLAITPSRALAPFMISFGGLPHGVRAAASPSQGVGAQRTAIQFVASPDAQTGSFSVMVVHREMQVDKSVLSGACQVNLFIR